MGLVARIWAFWIGFGSPGQNFGLVARIWAFPIGFDSRDWDLGLGTRILASKLGGGYGRRRRRTQSPRA